MVEEPTHVLSKMWKENESTDWMELIVVPVFRRGLQTLCGNHVGIRLIQAVMNRHVCSFPRTDNSEKNKSVGSRGHFSLIKVASSITGALENLAKTYHGRDRGY